MTGSAQRTRAIRRLVLCNALWGLSFPTMKALTLIQQAALPGVSSWFIAAITIVYRFAIAAACLLAISAPTLGRVSRDEILQGVGLGGFAAAGILLQLDGLAYTSASTSAFLTQCSCVLIPLWLGVRHRRMPGPWILLCCAMAIAGVAVLAQVDWHKLQFGRGELETILASVFFTGQILLLDRPEFKRNDAEHISLIMSTVMALCCLPVALITTSHSGDWRLAFASAPALGFLAILVVFCTLGAFRLMNRWQRHLTATEAGLIYCLEPVFASACALVLPGLFSRWANIDYPNEVPALAMIVGGGLITAANVAAQFSTASSSPTPDHSRPSSSQT